MRDGTAIWTSPTGKAYITHPGSRIFFPKWNTTTADISPPVATRTTWDRGLMMPRPQRTRAADQAARVKAERALNDPGDAPF
jgi:hypothetical protein